MMMFRHFVCVAVVTCLGWYLPTYLTQNVPPGALTQLLSRDDNHEEFLMAENLLKEIKESLPHPQRNCDPGKATNLRTQLVAGINYFFTTEFTCPDAVYLCDIVIYHKPWLNETTLTKSQCT